MAMVYVCHRFKSFTGKAEKGKRKRYIRELYTSRKKLSRICILRSIFSSFGLFAFILFNEFLILSRVPLLAMTLFLEFFNLIILPLGPFFFCP